MEGFGLVAVEWMDSAQAESGWRWLSEANLNVHLCRSVGWLIGEDDELLRLAQTVSAIGDDYQVCGVMAIPIRAIVGREAITSSSACPVAD